MAANKELVIADTDAGAIYTLKQPQPHVFKNYSSGTTVEQTILTVGNNSTTDVLAAGKVLDDGLAPTLSSHLTNKLYVDNNFLNKSLATAQTVVASNVTFSGTISASAVTASSSISTTGTGTITSAGRLTASNITTGTVNINTTKNINGLQFGRILGPRFPNPNTSNIVTDTGILLYNANGNTNLDETDYWKLQFPNTFLSIPTVICTVEYPGNSYVPNNVFISNVSVSSFTYYHRFVNNANGTSYINVHWIAFC